MKKARYLNDQWPFAKLCLWNTLFWIVLWLFSVYNNYQWALSAGAPFSWDMVFSWSFPYYLVMVLTGPIIIWFYGQWRVHSYVRQAGLNLGPALISGLLHQLALNIFYVNFHPVAVADTSRDLMEKLIHRYEIGFVFSANGFLYYWLCVGLLLGMDFFWRYRKQEMANLAMSAELNRAQFQTLQSQLQPHFLFNAFNSLSMLARQQKHSAVVDTIAKVSTLLRETLKLGEQPMLPLADELELVKRYLDVEHIRFRDRLEIDWQIEDGITTHVPTLILQPIVENAFIHGIAKSEELGWLMIKAQYQADQLVITVANGGPCLPDSWSVDEHLGIGLSNVIKRLELSYGKDFTLKLENLPDRQGVQTVICLPHE